MFKYTLSFDMYIYVKLKIYNIYLSKLLSFQKFFVEVFRHINASKYHFLIIILM